MSDFSSFDSIQTYNSYIIKTTESQHVSAGSGRHQVCLRLPGFMLAIGSDIESPDLLRVYSMPYLIKICHTPIQGTRAANVQVPYGVNRDKTRKTATIVQQLHCAGLVPTDGCTNIHSRKDKKATRWNKVCRCTVRYHIKEQFFYLLLNIHLTWCFYLVFIKFDAYTKGISGSC
jgi:hypothetical protein